MNTYPSVPGGSPTARLPLGWRTDQIEALIHASLGLAVLGSLAMFFGSLMLVTVESGRIAQALERAPNPATREMLASGATNTAPLRSGSTSVAPGLPDRTALGSSMTPGGVKCPTDG